MRGHPGTKDSSIVPRVVAAVEGRRSSCVQRSLAVRLGGRAGDASVWAAKALLDRAAHAGGDKDGAKALARLAAEQLRCAHLAITCHGCRGS